jgi:hypothetical protein
LAIAASVISSCKGAWAQACCAGSAAITPARVGPHDEALVGVQLQAADVYGSYGATGTFRRSPVGTTEYDLEQDLFGAVRVLQNGQISLLVPLVETHRSAPGTASFGGGLGDINLGARYDFIRTRQLKFVPGVALLGGLTVPTGTSPDAASKPLATDATGIGAFQGNLGVALEHLEGHWLFNVTGLVAKRAAHSAQGVTETLGTQYTGLIASGYTFDNEISLALMGSYSFEGDARINGASAPGSSRRTPVIRALAYVPVVDSLYMQGSLYSNPPVSSWGRNGPAAFGFTLAMVRTWS